MMRTRIFTTALGVIAATGLALPQGNGASLILPSGSDPACEAATLVSTGGQPPKNSKTLAVRWIGYSNFELAYNGQVILLDAYFDRGSMYPPLGFTGRRRAQS